MHRWFFLNEREKCENLDEEPSTATEIDDDKDKKKPKIPTEPWPFCCHYDGELQGNEMLAICGNCPILGNWNPAGAFVMQLTKKVTNQYEAMVEIPRDRDIEFRYLIIAWNPYKEELIVRNWETYNTPRVVRKCDNLLKDCDEYGWHNKKYSVNRAWAIYETYVQFKVFNAPFFFPNGLKERLLYVKLTPMYPIMPPECTSLREGMPLRLSLIDPLKEDVEMKVCAEMGLSHEFAFVDVCNLSSTSDNILICQPKWGVRCGRDDLTLFHCTIANFQVTRYCFDLYTYAYKAAADEPPYHFGYGYIMPDQLLGSEGSIKIKITCASTHRSLCQLTVEYLIIKPLPSYVGDMSETYAREWPRDKLPYDIGRRGCGQTYQTDKGDLIRENTLGSLNRVALHNADMAEIQVQLTNDSQAVIYHDHVLRVVHKPSAPVEELIKEHDIMLMPMTHFTQKEVRNIAGSSTRVESHVAFQCLTREQLLACKAFRFCGAETGELSCDKLMHEQMPFPLLSDVMEESPQQLGFLISVKWVQRDSNNRWQDGGFKPSFDRNYYVDQILELVFSSIGTRPVIFASDDCDICVLMRFKQNRYPVMLYTLNPKCPVQLKDQRVADFQTTVNTASAFEFYGLIVHVNTLLTWPTRASIMHDRGILIFAHGNELIDYSCRSIAKTHGVKGLIYDRIDQLNQAGTPTKPQFFMLETFYNRPLFQRLLVTELRIKCGFKTESELLLERTLRETTRPPSMWTFCVHHKNPRFLRKNIYFALSGNCDVLGNWNPKQALTMKQSTENPNLWSIEAEIPRDRLVAYRYFVYARDPILDPNAELMHLLYWESNVRPRYIRPSQRRKKFAELFGLNGKIDRAWLMSNSTYLFLKIFQAPFVWPEEDSKTTLNVRVSRLVQRGRDIDYLQPLICHDYDFCEVSTQSSPKLIYFEDQPTCGSRCGTEDLVVFRIMVSNRELTVYRLDFYDYEQPINNLQSGFDYRHFGYSIIMPKQLMGSDGSTMVQIIPTYPTATGVLLKLSYFWVTPLDNADEIFTMESTYQRHWDKQMGNIRIGHRGCGKTYIHDGDVNRENTLYSLNRAAEAGAEMAEINVMLTKDNIPILYSDYTLNVKTTLSQSVHNIFTNHDIFVLPQEHFTYDKLLTVSCSSSNFRVSIPTAAFTLEELQSVRALRLAKTEDPNVSCKCLLHEQLPFVTLRDVLEETNPDLGFVINFMRTQQLTNCCWDGDAFPPTTDANLFVDEILKDLFPLIYRRSIIFTSLNCDICTMLRFKQNLYPVIQTSSNPGKKPKYLDPRLNTFKETLQLARAMEFLGTNLHVNTVLQNSGNISQMAHNGGLVAFCYGESTLFRPVRTKILKFGIQGIIYDRIDQFDEYGDDLVTSFFILETDTNKDELTEIINTELRTKCKSLQVFRYFKDKSKMQKAIETE